MCKQTTRTLSAALIAVALTTLVVTPAYAVDDLPLELKLAVPPVMFLLVDTSHNTQHVSSAPVASGSEPTASSTCISDDTSGTSGKARLLEVKEVLTGYYDPDPATFFSCDEGDFAGLTVTQYDNGFMDEYSETLKFAVAGFDDLDLAPFIDDYGSTFSVSSDINCGIGAIGAAFNPTVGVLASDATATIAAQNALAQLAVVGYSSRTWGSGNQAFHNAALDDVQEYLANDAEVNSSDVYSTCRQKAVVVITSGVFTNDDCYPGCVPWPDGDYMTVPLQAADLLSNEGIKTYFVGYNVDSGDKQDIIDAAIAGGTCEITDLGLDGAPGGGDDTYSTNCFYDVTSQGGLDSALQSIAGTMLEGKSSRTRAVTSQRTSFRDTETGMYEVSASFEVTGDGGQTWLGHLERATFKCSSGALVADSIVDFADTLDTQASRTIYVADAAGALVAIDSSAAETDYAGGGENPFTAACAGAWDAMYTTVNGAFTYYDASNVGSAVPSNFFCNVDGDCVGLQTCEDGGCRDTTTQCASTLDCCLGIPGAVDGLDRCLYSCNEGYCTDMVVATPCTTHTTCGAGQICWGGACVNGMIRACEAERALPHQPLGAIQYSDPVIVGGPELDLPSPEYTAFRIANEGRDTMLYVMGKDAMLHAFLLGGLNGNTSSEGEEQWAFVPTKYQDDLISIVTGDTFHDGPLIVKDIRMYRDTAVTPVEVWKTVLLGNAGTSTAGAENGAYYAIDVTDPAAPVLMWEIENDATFDRLANPIVEAAMGAVYIDDGTVVREKAVAFIPGGNYTGVSTTSGKALYVVDLADGSLIRAFTADSAATALPGKITGAPAVYNGFAGSRVTRAFVGDEDGRLLRVDLGDPDPANWTIDIFFDPTDVHFISGETIDPVYEAPGLALNSQRQLVVVYGNGDQDALLDTGSDGNFVVSLVETYDISFNVTASLNWFQALSSAEKLTGQPLIYNSLAYFPTFARGTGDCDFGNAKLWAPHFTRDDGSDGPVPAVDLGIDGNSDLDLSADFADNTVIYGLEITDRPACVATTNPSTGVLNYTNASASEPQLVVQTGTAPYGSGTPPTTTSTDTSSISEVAEKVRVDLPMPTTSLKTLSWSLIYE